MYNPRESLKIGTPMEIDQGPETLSMSINISWLPKLQYLEFVQIQIIWSMIKIPYKPTSIIIV